MVEYQYYRCYVENNAVGCAGAFCVETQSLIRSSLSFWEQRRLSKWLNVNTIGGMLKMTLSAVLALFMLKAWHLAVGLCSQKDKDGSVTRRERV
jgi:hypothetical protein